MAESGVPAYEVVQLREPENDYALVIPVINEDGRLTRQLARIKATNPKVDVIVADGGSTDGSTDPESLRELGVSALLTKTGSGRLSAQLRMAIHFCLGMRYQAIITMDGNGKDGVDGIAKIAQALAEGCDFVQGSRFTQGGTSINTPIGRYIAIRFIHAPLTSLSARHWFTDTTNGFRGHSRRLLQDRRVDPLRDEFDGYELLAYLPIRAARLGFRITEVPTTRAYPRGEAAPTKIRGLAAQAVILRVLFKACRGDYSPHPRAD